MWENIHHVKLCVTIMTLMRESQVLKCEPWKSPGFEMVGDLCFFTLSASHYIIIISAWVNWKLSAGSVSNVFLEVSTLPGNTSGIQAALGNYLLNELTNAFVVQRTYITFIVIERGGEQWVLM